MSDRDIREGLDEIYEDIPHYEPSEEEVEDQFKKFEAFLKQEELTSLDLDFDQ